MTVLVWVVSAWAVLAVIAVLAIGRFTRFVRSKDLGEFLGDPPAVAERRRSVRQRILFRRAGTRWDRRKPAA